MSVNHIKHFLVFPDGKRYELLAETERCPKTNKNGWRGYYRVLNAKVKTSDKAGSNAVCQSKEEAIRSARSNAKTNWKNTCGKPKSDALKRLDGVFGKNNNLFS